MGMRNAPLIEARELTVRFGKVTALDGLDLNAPPGEVLAILGPNGAGKTTFVRTVATLQRPDGGELRVRGHDVVRDRVAVRRDIGLAGQFAAVEPTMSGRENLEMTARLFGHGRPAARRAAAAVIEQLGLGEVADRRSAGYSGGQRRRLDPAGRREVWDAVRGLAAAGTDILLTTHYLDEADELADHVVVIDHGRTVASGTIGDLKASVGRDVVEAVVTDPARLDQAGQVLRRVTSHPPRLDRGSRRATAPAAGGTDELAAVIRGLDEAGIGVDEIGLRRPTLDEVFLALTGDHTDPATSSANVTNGSSR
jgi:ABC-2 type transport system ATP-binding protein